ncbi:MAG: LuxR C-terminal-related transcriptional regulator [Myxococcales bacterium]|jgi:DNA-binding NarL/FixJ family response regulator
MERAATIEGAEGQSVRCAPCPPRRLWARLCAGELRVLDHYDHRGRRTLLLSPAAPADAAGRAMSPVEARVARMMGEALSNKEIAHRLRISESAAENHVARCMRKLGLGDRIALVMLYTQLEDAAAS